jgi:hypothetical protein
MHSHRQHRRDTAGHRRAKQFLHENRGGACAPVKKKHSGAIGHRAPADYDEPDIKAEGHKGKHMYARGGKTKHQTNIVIVGHPHPPLMGAGPVPGAAPPIPPAASPGLPPGAGLPPQAMMPGQGLPLRARGGNVHHSTYEDPPEDISNYKPAHTRKNQGGSLSGSYGSASGMSRRAEYEKLKQRKG